MSCWNYKARGSKSTIAGVTRLPGFEWKPLRLTTGSSHSRHPQIWTNFPFFLCSSRSDRPGRLARPPSGHWVQPLQGSFQRLPEDGKSAAIGRSRHTSAHYGSCRPRLYPWRSVCLFRPHATWSFCRRPRKFFACHAYGISRLEKLPLHGVRQMPPRPLFLLTQEGEGSPQSPPSILKVLPRSDLLHELRSLCFSSPLPLRKLAVAMRISWDSA